MTTLPADQVTTYLLPPAAYTEQSWFDRESEQLFENTWVFCGVEHDLAAPGDFLTIDVGRSPIVVVRDGDDGLRAFHNICRHRGLLLVDDAGNCGKGLVCPYHRWNYGLDGSLRSVPQRDQYPELDYSQLGLHAVRCETWKSLVFVNLDPEAETLDSWMGDLGSQLEGFHPESLVEISTLEHPVASNWKLYVENHVDWLHLWYIHAGSLSQYHHSSGERREFGRHWTSFEPLTEEPDPAVDPGGLLPIPGLSALEASNGAHFIFPSLTLFTNAGYWMLGQVVPEAPDRFTLRLRIFAVPGSDPAGIDEVIETVMHEDYAVAEAIQKALRSPAFEVGPLASSYEREIMRFHRHYLHYVDSVDQP